MLNRLLSFSRKEKLFCEGEKIICAVSGGADSMALLFAMLLLRDEGKIELECAHFNHHLRGAESDRDAAFVRDFCEGYGIRLHYGQASVVAGKKGLEAAARDARYAFLCSLGGKVATAHTADDNAETVLMHLVRGTGLKGLCGIAPKNGCLIRPMLTVTREEVLAFISEYHIPFVEDSSNHTDAFLRNRIRHKVMPLLNGENPSFSENVSQMALRLREEEAYLASCTELTCEVSKLREMEPALRTRAIAAFLENNGVQEANAQHIALCEALVFSQKPSAKAQFPGGVTISRNYGVLERQNPLLPQEEIALMCPCKVTFGSYQVTCRRVDAPVNTPFRFTVSPVGECWLRTRKEGDRITFSYGTKTLKKLFIDEKIPASLRSTVPVVFDRLGLLGVCGYGADTKRVQAGDYIEISFAELHK